MPESKEVSAAQQLMGDFAPKLAELIDGVLFAETWAREELLPSDRSLVTVAALIANGNTEHLPKSLKLAKVNIHTEKELAANMIHLTFYADLPYAISSILVAKDVFKE